MSESATEASRISPTSTVSNTGTYLEKIETVKSKIAADKEERIIR
mgnify:CR=1 FL=1